MAPYTITTVQEVVSIEKNTIHQNEDRIQKFTKKNNVQFMTDLIWINIISITFLHILCLYGLLTFPYFYKLKTFLYGEFLNIY